MVRKQRKRISYVLPLASHGTTSGHRLGVNGLAVDPQNSILYTGGRDGVICSWDLNLNLDPFSDDPDSRRPSVASPASSLRSQVQAHTHWINDIALAQDNEALISASSDISVKVWRPHAQDHAPPQTIGLHSDYVKRLAYPGHGANWVASGGLDRKIHLWDLNGNGERLQFNVGQEENTAKGSVYALAATPTILASGGPESVVRVWDLRSARQVTKLVGHTDNIRDILISQDGDTLMSASSDQTIKVWSMTAGRCMFTLTMHQDSVWSLFSNHPRLSVFYSSDRSGIVAKTDTRGCTELDEGLSVAVCREHEGIGRVTATSDYIWTTTSSSSINRWRDVDMEASVQHFEPYGGRRASASTSRSRQPSLPTSPIQPGSDRPDIPLRSVLRMSNAVPFRIQPRRETDADTRRGSVATQAVDNHIDEGIEPVHMTPDHTIEGQHGLIKHVMLNDRRSVLTLDTAGEVILWDLLKCAPAKMFGKREIDDVLAEVQTTETVPYWCSVDTRTGSLTCTLEETNCFDAEMYADELTIDEKIEFREDQRINLGKWILRYLFSYLIDEEIRRDQSLRKELIAMRRSMDRPSAPLSIQMPASGQPGWRGAGPDSASTLRPTNGFHVPILPTPGMNIGLATPGLDRLPTNTGAPPLPPIPDEGNGLSRPVTNNDYFSQPTQGQAYPTTPGGTESVTTPGGADLPPGSPAIDGKETEKAEKGLFGSKKFKMNFNMRALTKSTSKPAADIAATTKPADTASEDGDSRNSKTEDKLIQDNFQGALQKIRLGYEEQLILLKREDALRSSRDPEGIHGPPPPLDVESTIAPSLPNETPVLKLPLNTVILIQEDRIDSGGVADLFEGTIGTLGQAGNADLIEQTAPMWLADCLLRNQIPHKEIVKTSFVLEPWEGKLPNIASDGETNTRLNANRMLRARKIMTYVAERIEPLPEKAEPGAMKPEEYLELYCNGQLIHPTMTLATIRSHIWRGAGDIILHYKANGKKPIRFAQLPSSGSMLPRTMSSSMLPATPGSQPRPGNARPLGSFSGASTGSPYSYSPNASRTAMPGGPAKIGAGHMGHETSTSTQGGTGRPSFGSRGSGE